MRQAGFTLIELLVTVAIIGILAAVAIPNYLNAQTRAKTARAKADMAAVAVAIECYAVDNGEYPPNDGEYNVTPAQLVEPVSYLTNRKIVDPFAVRLNNPVWGDDARLYTYARVTEIPWEDPSPPVEGVDHPFFNPGARKKYGRWHQLSIGPDGLYSGMDQGLGDWPTFLFDTPYDPTNGTFIFGNILRTQKESAVMKTKTY